MRPKRVMYVLVMIPVIIYLIKTSVYITNIWNIFDKDTVKNKPSDEKFLYTHNTPYTNVEFADSNDLKSLHLIKPWNAIEFIRRDCGQLCNSSRTGSPGPFFNHTSASVDCPGLFKNEFIDQKHGLQLAPKKIPDNLLNDFTMNGRLKLHEWYFNQPYLDNMAQTPVWTIKMVDDYIALAKKGELGGNYGITETNALRDGLKHAPGIKNGRVLIIGSEIPWVEACVLEAGATEIVTLEYGKIFSEHPKIKTMTPTQFKDEYLMGSLGKFDAVVTFSSVEHSGLGRYGDALNPWGDIITIARAWCVTKEKGSLTIGVMYDFENDNIKFNAGRWYGKIRYPFLTTNWKQYYRGRGLQRVHVFINENVDELPHMEMFLREPYYFQTIRYTNKTYSQVKQDEHVYKIFPKQNGFFVEMGGYDGQTLSNTLWLERNHNWTGLLVEADPDLCESIDKLKRRIWRLCGCISTKPNITFIKGSNLGSDRDSVDKDHMKQLNLKNQVVVPCFTLKNVLDQINVSHIDYFSLDVEGAEMIVLNSIKKELKSKEISVDIWTIEYRVWDGNKIVVNSSLKNLKNLRLFFKDLGGYVEHSQLSTSVDTSDGHALDVVFINVKTWCKRKDVLPDGTNC